MTDDQARPLSCDEAQPLLADLALGVLSEPDRQAVLDHLHTCPGCQQEEIGLLVAAEALVLLASPREPPVGFETRLFERITAERTLGQSAVAAPLPPPLPSPPVLPARKRRPAGHIRPGGQILRLAAAVIAAAVIFGGGLLAGLNGSSGHTGSTHGSAQVALAASVTSGTRSLGDAELYPGKPAWMYMELTLHKPAHRETVVCQAVLRNGTTRTLGRFDLVDGHGSWGATLWVPLSTVRSLRVVEPDGTVVGTAWF